MVQVWHMNRTKAPVLITHWGNFSEDNKKVVEQRLGYTMRSWVEKATKFQLCF